MKKKCVSLYIDDFSLKLTVVKGTKVKKWAEQWLEPGIIDGMVVTDADKLSGQIVQLLKTQKAHSSRLSIGISGINCLTRQITLPALPRNLLEEAVVREARRLFPLPIEQLYLSWQTIPDEEGKIQVFLVAMKRASIDSLFQVFQRVKIKVTSLSIKPLALSRLLRDDALLVDVQAGDLDVVILMNGVPQLVRSVSFPAASMTWAKKVPLILDEIDRTLKFYAANNPGKPLGAGLPLYVSGELARQTRFWPNLKERFGMEVAPLETPLENPNGFKWQGFVPNLALSVQERSSFISFLPVTNLNLLPVEYRIQPIKWERVLAAPVTVTAVALVVPLTLLINSASANIASTRDQLDITNKILQEKQAQKQDMKKELKKLEENLAGVRQHREDAAKVLNELDLRSVTVNADLQTIIENLFQGVQLSGIDIKENDLTVEGECPTVDAVLTYARALANSGRFTQTVVANINEQDSKQSFTLNLMK